MRNKTLLFAAMLFFLLGTVIRLDAREPGCDSPATGDGDLDVVVGVSLGIQYNENLSFPEADFNYTQEGLTFNFTDNSTGNVMAWHWDFGDGTTSDIQNPKHTYLENGTYEVCLTVWEDLNFGNTICKKVYAPVFPWHADPVPNPFGLEAPSPPSPVWPSALRLADFDNDGVKEAILIVEISLNGARDVRYFENSGTDSVPEFYFVESYPFGIPTYIAPWQIVDIDGDGDLDIFHFNFGLDTPLKFLENMGDPETPWFGESEVEVNSFSFEPPVNASGDLIDNAFFSFVDIDADGDFDLQYGGRFTNNLPDENYYFYLNQDTSDNGTAPRFSAQLINPFNLPQPALADAWIFPNFVDIDCDNDWDFFATYAGVGERYFENSGTPQAPDFGSSPVVWLLPDEPPPGFLPYNFGDWMDIGGDGDMDFLSLSGGQIAYWENTNGGMACIPIIVAVSEARLDASLSLYPNPARNVLNLDLQSNESLRELDIEIFDILGQRVKNLRRQPAGNALQESISAEDLTVGVYVVRIRSEGKFIARKFIRME